MNGEDRCARLFPPIKARNRFCSSAIRTADSDVVYPELVWLKESGLHIWYDEGISPGTALAGGTRRGNRSIDTTTVLYLSRVCSVQQLRARDKLRGRPGSESSFLSTWSRRSCRGADCGSPSSIDKPFSDTNFHRMSTSENSLAQSKAHRRTAGQPIQRTRLQSDHAPFGEDPNSCGHCHRFASSARSFGTRPGQRHHTIRELAGGIFRAHDLSLRVDHSTGTNRRSKCACLCASTKLTTFKHRGRSCTPSAETSSGQTGSRSPAPS